MTKKILLPSIRARMGDWFFYNCVMNLSDIANRISYAEQIHTNKELSKLIQRTLEEKRTSGIKDFLLHDSERFFSSLVVAVYGGQPAWSSIDIKGTIDSDFQELEEHQGSNLGFLSFNGEEKLFALDGQHRLAGIKKAIAENPLIGNESMSIIFVGHENSPNGLRRTRKLFTTLNKNAKAVSKSEIIALDENDSVAIITRRLLEESNIFSGNAISYKKGNSIPRTEKVSFTTITNLYDVLSIFLGEIHQERDKQFWRLQSRPSDEILNDLYSASLFLFNKMAEHFTAFTTYINQQPQAHDASLFRHDQGGNVLFRPIGLLLFIEILAKIHKREKNLSISIEILSRLPMEMSDYPYRNVLWKPSSQKMANSNKILVRELLLHKLGLSTFSQSQLEEKLRKIEGVSDTTQYFTKLT